MTPDVPDQPTRLVIGAMTGTSIDAIDVAAISIEGVGLEMTARFIAGESEPLAELEPQLRRLASEQPASTQVFSESAMRLGQLHAKVICRLVKSLTNTSDCKPTQNTLSFVAVHGQTVFHRPPLSMQLINPAPIVAAAGCPVVFDLRQADLAAGGQGAPITPLADWIMFGRSQRRRAIVNLGGFCNMTILPAGDDRHQSLREIIGFDLCVCNQLLDAIARKALDCRFDADGRSAIAGTVHEEAAMRLARVLSKQRQAGRSLGTGDESPDWLEQHRNILNGEDLAATAVTAIATCICDELADHCETDEIVLAGGGARNMALTKAIERLAPVKVMSCETLGVPLDMREATAMAILGTLSADGVPITLPQITGCRSPAPIAGVWAMRGVS